MSKIGIIVDGPGDKAAIDARYDKKFRVIKTDGPRGHCAPVDKIIAKSKKQISILESFNCSKIILMLDFECRKMPYKEFILELESEIKKHKFSKPLEVVVLNQMIENWFLADIEILSSKKKILRDKLKQKNYEGKHGKDEIKKLTARNKSYNEIQHGKEFFPLIRESVATKNSGSFNDFIEKINTHNNSQ
jgi:hypothetical protein